MFFFSSSGGFSGKDTNGALEGFLLAEELFSKNEKGENVGKEIEKEAERAWVKKQREVLGRDLQ